ncbi:MAG: DUF2341 domain-containing protein, partial [Candidatus Bathyarchaeia archaeon]
AARTHTSTGGTDFFDNFFTRKLVDPEPTHGSWGSEEQAGVWQYRKSHVINSASGARTDYQVRIKVHYGSGTDSGEDVYLNGKCRADFGDVRFTDDDGITLLNYWMEEKVDGDYAVFWVKVADDLSVNPATIYIYYGNPSATTTSNIKAASLWGQGDDFNDNSRDTTIWDEHEVGAGIVSETNQRLECYCPYNGDRAGYVSKDSRYIDNCEIYVTVSQTVVTELCLFIHTQKITNDEPYFYNDWYRVTLWTWEGWYGFYVQERISDTVNTLYVGNQLSSYEKIKIQVTDGTVRFLEQDTLRATTAFSLNTQNCYIYLAARTHTSTGGTDFFDNFFTRKLVDPEPTHGSWGSEEAQPEA